MLFRQDGGDAVVLAFKSGHTLVYHSATEVEHVIFQRENDVCRSVRNGENAIASFDLQRHAESFKIVNRVLWGEAVYRRKKKFSVLGDVSDKLLG